MHWVIVAGLAGAYQYFENVNLPTLGEFRTLWRLDNTTFPRGKTDLRDELLPPLDDFLPENKVQDETWLQVSAVDVFPNGKIWGPWLWYLNDGSLPDAAKRSKAEFSL